MEKKRRQGRGPLFQTVRQIQTGAGAAAGGFALYLALLALGRDLAADLACVAFAVEAAWTFLSAASLRGRDKEAVSYSLLWGTGALALLLGGCALLGVKLRLGL